MNKKIGFLGMGKMATAIATGILKGENKIYEKIYGYDPYSEILNIEKLSSNAEVVKNSDVIFICTKPFFAKDILNEIKDFITPQKLIVSIMAGVSINSIKKYLGENAKIIRIMPNTPALINCGMSAIVKDENVSDEEKDFIKNIIKNIGEVIEATEDKIDIITALSGSGPAFYYYLIDLFAKSAEKLGLDYQTALLLSSQTALGASKMILNTNSSVSDLITAVTTKGGCTEVGNNILNNSNVNLIIDKVINDTAKKAYELGKS